MDAELCEGEAEPRSQKLLPSKPSERNGLHAESEGRLEGPERFRGGHRKDAKEVGAATDRKGTELGLRAGGGLGGLHGSLRKNGGRAELTSRPKDGSKPAAKQLLKGGQKMQAAKLSSRDAEVLLPSEEDRDAPGNGDFERGNRPRVEVGAERPHHQRKRVQQDAPNTQSKRLNSQRKDQHQQPPPSQAAVAAPATVLVEKAPSSAQVPSTSAGGWEKFLPRRDIKILLAEDDDSTRQVVGALLRNCNYEVSSVSDGMKAWEMLENPDNHFDLVLTDVVMPSLSGVGLLSKIMNNEAGKRIPVVMMSSHDSLDIVFRCLSKGATDFLVKPVRKNELRNLWQHVWRSQSSCGSGSGGGSRSGSGNGKLAAGARSKIKYGNNSGSNDGSNDGSDDNSSGLDVRGGSDNGSGTQAIPHPGFKQKREKSDGEEGQATSLQKLSNEQIMGQDLEMATRRTAPLDIQHPQNTEEQSGADPMEEENEPPSASGNSDDNKVQDDGDEYNCGATNSGASSAEAIDLIGGITFQNKDDVDEGAESGDGAEGIDRGGSNSPANDKCVTGSSPPPLLELSLKRPRTPDEGGKGEKRVLRHSGSSAFSRYSTNGTANYQLPSGSPLSLTGSMRGVFEPPLSHSPGVGQGQLSMPLDRGDSVNGGSEQQHQPQLPLHIPRVIQTNGTSQEMGSSVVGSSTPEGVGYPSHMKDEGLSVTAMSGQGFPVPMSLHPPRAGMIYDGIPAVYGQAMHPIFYSHHHSPHPPWANAAAAAAHLTDTRSELYGHDSRSHTACHPSQQLHHLPHQHHHSPHPQPPPLQHQDDQVVLNHLSGPPRCGSSNSNMAGSIPDGSGGQSGSSNGYGSAGNGNGSVNGSGSGSNITNLNGQSFAGLYNAAPAHNGDGYDNNTTNNNEISGCGSIGPTNSVIGTGGEHEQNRFAQREAALNKFRQKRKDRCFEKKVRYQSRKRLAEQRPRVRGQFVRQTVYNDSNTDYDMMAD